MSHDCRVPFSKEVVSFCIFPKERILSLMFTLVPNYVSVHCYLLSTLSDKYFWAKFWRTCWNLTTFLSLRGNVHNFIALELASCCDQVLELIYSPYWVYLGAHTLTLLPQKLEPISRGRCDPAVCAISANVHKSKRHLNKAGYCFSD